MAVKEIFSQAEGVYVELFRVHGIRQGKLLAEPNANVY